MDTRQFSCVRCIIEDANLLYFRYLNRAGDCISPVNVPRGISGYREQKSAG